MPTIKGIWNASIRAKNGQMDVHPHKFTRKRQVRVTFIIPCDRVACT